ncbi:putative transcription factor TGA like domain-containing protein [Helianthus annuus]|nr:putative transcription factor TGA like domain-containing protein [Helianthus annuus]
MSNTNSKIFQNFFQGWLIRQQDYLHELQSTLSTSNASKDKDYGDLINPVLAHYHEYYEHKSRLANHDVLLVFSPPWFSQSERSFFFLDRWN